MRIQCSVFSAQGCVAPFPVLASRILCPREGGPQAVTARHQPVLCLVTQLCPNLCDPMDCSRPGASLRGDSPGKNTGVRCHALLQGIFLTQELNRNLLHCGRILYQLSCRWPHDDASQSSPFHTQLPARGHGLSMTLHNLKFCGNWEAFLTGRERVK